MAPFLEIRNLHVTAEDKEILKGVTLTIQSGEIHAIMGPNGSGKSTLCHTLMGHPKYTVTKGEIIFDGQNVLELSPDKRARLGLFLGFQYPREIPGITFSNFLRTCLNTHREKPINVMDFNKLLEEKMELIEIPKDFKTRAVNEGFSGGEKKRAEILQLTVLEPKIAVLDETDSGLDIDALKIVAKSINITAKKTHMGVLLITHYQRLLNYIKPNFIHIMVNGKIIESGKKDLALEVEKKGYETMASPPKRRGRSHLSTNKTSR